MAKIVNWLIDEHSYRLFEGSGFALVMSVIALGLVISICCSKKLRSKLF